MLVRTLVTSHTQHSALFSTNPVYLGDNLVPDRKAIGKEKDIFFYDLKFYVSTNLHISYFYSIDNYIIYVYRDIYVNEKDIFEGSR